MKYSVVERFILRSDVIVGEQHVPLYDLEAVAGLRALFVDEQVPMDEIQIAGIARCDGAIHVRGDSMYPRLKEGDVILYKIVPNRRGGLFFGQMYLLAFDLDGEEYITVKYVHQSDMQGYYRLESENPAYADRDIPVDCVRAMAIVKATLRYECIK